MEMEKEVVEYMKEHKLSVIKEEGNLYTLDYGDHKQSGLTKEELIWIVKQYKSGKYCSLY